VRVGIRDQASRKGSALTGKDFSEKVAIVTGSGRGIGRAIALAFASEGAMVGVLDQNLPSAQDVAREIETSGGSALAVGADVSAAESVGSAVEVVCQQFGGVDVVVNNAGVERYGSAEEIDEADWDFVIGTNLRGAWLMSRAVLPLMRSRGGGVIVNMASVQAFVNESHNIAYAVSKAGLLALTRGIAVDHASERIRCVCVAPGSVRTPMLEAAADKARPGDLDAGLRAWAESIPIGRIIKPGEVASLVLFLASDSAAAITGSCHLVDGGVLAKRGL
jgi:meso-butanediol dehydrogenase / (S,S)-butanediol dehydrogenase / diacetyl reductase